MANVTERKNGIPLVIIGVVLLLAIGGIWWLTNRPSTPSTVKAANNTNLAKPVGTPANLPPGANPPNESGSKTAAVTVEEYADFQCPTCGMMHPVMNEIKSIYGSRIHFIFRNYPLPMHDKSYEAAVAAEAAGLQGKFWDMQNMLFTNQQAWTGDPNYKQVWDGYAQKIGLDVAKFQTDVAGLGAKSRVDADLVRARALNVSATPTIYINGIPVDSSNLNVNGLKQLIDAALQNAGQGQTPAAANSNAALANTNK